jgi:hypothetical protein
MHNKQVGEGALPNQLFLHSASICACYVRDAADGMSENRLW